MSLLFYERVAYNDYAFLMEIEECGQLVRDLGDRNVMIMRNHGLLTAGGSVGEAFMRMYYLDKACEIQLDALATGRELELPPPEVCEEAARRSMVIDGTPSARWSGRRSSASSTAKPVLPHLISRFRREARSAPTPCPRAHSAPGRCRGTGMRHGTRPQRTDLFGSLQGE